MVFLDRQVLYPNSWVATVVEQVRGNPSKYEPSYLLCCSKCDVWNPNIMIRMCFQTVMEYYSCDAGSFMEMELIALRREEMVQERNRLVYEDNRNCQEISAYAKEVYMCFNYGTDKISVLKLNKEQ